MTGNEPAFPTIRDWHPQMGIQVECGMTYHQWLVGMAMQGIVSATEIAVPECVASRALDMADAIIAELNRREQEKGEQK